MTSRHLRLVLTGLALLGLSARPPGADRSADSRPAATVNGEVITLAELDEAVGARLAARPQGTVTMEPSAAARVHERLQWKTLRAMVTDVLETQAAKEAQRKGAIAVDPGSLQKALNEVRRAYPNEADLRRAHPTTRGTRDEWAQRQALKGALMRELTKGVAVTEQEAREFCARYPAAFSDPKTGKAPAFDTVRERALASALVSKKMDRTKDWRKGLWREGKVQFHIPVPERL